MTNIFLSIPSNKKLFESFLSLTFFQIVNYIIPLVTIPYLSRVLGPDKFGLVMFAQTLMIYFNILTDYGFNLSATRQVAINSTHRDKLKEIFSSVLIIKMILVFISLLILLVLILQVEKFRVNSEIFILAFPSVIGQAMFPLWFFQGLERMRYIAILSFLSKFIYVVLVFAFVKNNFDYPYVPLFYSLGNVISGIVALTLCFHNFGVSLFIPTFDKIRDQLKDGFYVFLGQISIQLFNSVNILLLGLFSENIYVGYYTGADRIIKAFNYIAVPIVNSIYPHVAGLLAKSKNDGFKFLKKVLFIFAPMFLAISVFLFIFGEQIAVLALGEEFSSSGIIVKILSILPFSVFLNNIFGTQILINLNRTKEYTLVFLFAGLINVFLILVLVWDLKHIGVAIATLCSELFVLFGTYYFATKEGFKIL
ncbi:MAG: flippase [Candidatus Kryptonium sp.]|nr:flippase [Candidatus Kryptonium sp.]